jgi:hypothetical protein
MRRATSWAVPRERGLVTAKWLAVLMYLCLHAHLFMSTESRPMKLQSPTFKRH